MLSFNPEVNRKLQRSISYHDGYENFYHGFLVGLLEYNDDYLVESNRELGTDRSDIIVKNVVYCIRRCMKATYTVFQSQSAAV